MKSKWTALAVLALAGGALACDDDDDGSDNGGTGPESPATGIEIRVDAVNLSGGDVIPVFVDGGLEMRVTDNGTSAVTLDGIEPDTYLVSLGELPSGCSATPEEQLVELSAGALEEVEFTVSCSTATE